MRQSGLERLLLHLIKIRASQINGCAFCLDMHTREARADREAEERLYLLGAGGKCWTIASVKGGVDAGPFHRRPH